MPAPRRTPIIALALLLALAIARPVSAETVVESCDCAPFWQIVAAALAGAFIAVVVTLLLTRWRRLFIQDRPDER